MEYPDWQDTPNCRGADSEAFFTETGSSTYTNIGMLKRICGSCAVVDQCLDYALKHEVMGYWGNTTEFQRKEIRRKLNIIPRQLYLDYN
jgi:WhiB family redox-sensing transcriptional regulator